MKDLNLEKHLACFLQKHVPEKEPFLIAFSGGVDSTALLYAIAEVAQGRCPHIVHVDHGWRRESEQEALWLEERVRPLSIPFHSVRLKKAPEGENLEEWSRRERLASFLELGRKVETNSVFLAHHADDQIEVVLKRVLEGSSIRNFRGMRVVEEREGIRLLRPFLHLRKSTLLNFVQRQKLLFLEDPTNKDPKYLRARFRTTLLPFLKDSFGKEFEESILRVSQESLLLDEWIQESLTTSFSFGEGEAMSFATSKSEVVSEFLLYHLIDLMRKKWGLPSPSRSQLQGIAHHFSRSENGPRSFPVGKGIILVEHNWLLVFREKQTSIEEILCDKEEGKKTLSCWEVSWKPSFFKEHGSFEWNDLFQGKTARIYIPKQTFRIAPSSDRLLKTRKSWNRESKIPSSCRRFIPAIIQQEQLVGDFLTGYSLPLRDNSLCYEVSVKLVM